MQNVSKEKFSGYKTPLRVDALFPFAWSTSHQFKTGFFVTVPSPNLIEKATKVNMSTETSVVRLRLAKERQALGRRGTKSSSHRLWGSESALGKVQVKGVHFLFTVAQR